jgi:membrane-bound metal-dependent hydrolase YbcI (DUF457 family)
MFAVGHFALGYLTAKIASKPLTVNINLPLVFLASVLPDIDLLIPQLMHRGPVHSILFYIVLFFPIILFYRKKALPYFIAVIQHLIIGDYLTGGTQLLWPLSNAMYSLNLGIASFTNITLEWSFFLISTAIMFKTEDMLSLFKHHPTNLILSIPVLTILLPTVLSFPIYVPLVMVIPHLVYLALFGFSILSDTKAILTKSLNLS